MNPLGHWSRNNALDFRAVIAGLTHPTSCAAGFDNKIAAQDVIERIKKEDLGISVNVSTSIDGAAECCHHAHIARHSVGYSLGFEGTTEKLPNSQAMTLSTMCGHGMISHSLAKKMIDFVKENRRTPEQAAGCLARFCSCGVFNPSPVRRILDGSRLKAE